MTAAVAEPVPQPRTPFRTADGAFYRTLLKHRVAGLVLRPLVSVALLAALFWKFGAGSVWGTLRSASPLWLAAGVGLVVLAMLVSAWKWQILLASHGLRVGLGRLFGTYLIGLFFNNFLPSNIGGDVVRVHDVTKLTGQGAATTASVIGERLLAGLALALTAAVALLFSVGASRQVGASVALVLVVFILLIALIASARVRTLAGHLLPRARGSAVARVMRHMGESFGDRGAVVRVMVLSFAFHATVVLFGWSTFQAIGARVPLATCFLFIPIIMAIQLVPVSLNGLGVREGAYVFFFGSAGLDAGQAVAASLLFALLTTLVSLSGGVLFATRR